MNNNIKAVIFDCDGVLVDSENLMTQVLFESLAHTDVTVTQQQVDTHIVGKTTEQFLQFFADYYPSQLSSEFFEQHAQAVSAAFANRLQKVPSIELLLASVKVPMACASNSQTESLLHKLSLVNLQHYFDGHIYGADQVARPKPAADLFLYAAQQLALPPEDCLVIEDSATGVIAAKAAGMCVIGHSRKTESLLALGAEAVFDNMPAIKNYIDQRFAVIC